MFFFSNSPINGFGPCSLVEEVANYQNALSKARLVRLFFIPFLLLSIPSSFQARWLQLSKMTGCMPLCSVRFLHILPTSLCPATCHRSFTFAEKSSEGVYWARNYSSAFYLDVKTSGYIHQTEFYACNTDSKMDATMSDVKAILDTFCSPLSPPFPTSLHVACNEIP